jgi:hypothetical protein
MQSHAGSSRCSVLVVCRSERELKEESLSLVVSFSETIQRLGQTQLHQSVRLYLGWTGLGRMQRHTSAYYLKRL